MLRIHTQSVSRMLLAALFAGCLSSAASACDETAKLDTVQRTARGAVVMAKPVSGSIPAPRLGRGAPSAMPQADIVLTGASVPASEAPLEIGRRQARGG
jgi:hypothetical protein